MKLPQTGKIVNLEQVCGVKTRFRCVVDVFKRLPSNEQVDEVAVVVNEEVDEVAVVVNEEVDEVAVTVNEGVQG